MKDRTLSRRCRAQIDDNLQRCRKRYLLRHRNRGRRRDARCRTDNRAIFDCQLRRRDCRRRRDRQRAGEIHLSSTRKCSGKGTAPETEDTALDSDRRSCGRVDRQAAQIAKTSWKLLHFLVSERPIENGRLIEKTFEFAKLEFRLLKVLARATGTIRRDANAVEEELAPIRRDRNREMVPT